MIVYTVIAYRWGSYEDHAYALGVYEDKQEALDTAELEEKFRGGKYSCEVLEWKLGQTLEGEPGMPYQIIKGLGD